MQETKTAFHKLLMLSSFIIAIYHMLGTFYLLQNPIQHQIISLGTMIFILFLTIGLNSPSKFGKIISIILVALGMFCVVYLYVNYDKLQDSIGFPDNLDMIIGAILIFVVIVGTWLSWGAIFPTLAMILLLYFFFGHHLPQPFYHSKIPVDLAVSYLSVGFTGIFGSLLGVMASFGCVLLLFGTLLEVGGADQFFLEVGKFAGRYLSGGPGQTAVIGSSLVGMVSGGAISNVIITGSFTIPMMKKAGFHPPKAAAIEATASTGSQLMPPIMGIAAFLMAGFLGVEYSEIMIAAILPSLLFYISVAWGVQLIAKKDGIKGTKEPVDRSIYMNYGLIFILPLSVLIVMLMKGFGAGISGTLVIVLTILLMYIRKSTRPSFISLLKGFENGIIMSSKITLAVCSVGLVSQVFITTGLALKITTFIEAMSMGIPWLTLLFTMFLALILGVGLPAAAAYSLVAILVAPSLIQMGIEPIRAHFFAFYFSIISAVTPPVALASLAAASIADCSFWKTSIEATKLAAPTFIMPFLFVYNPVFLLRPDTEILSGVITVTYATIAVLSLESLIYNYLVCRLKNVEKILLAIGMSLCFAFCITPNGILMILGFGCCFTAFLTNVRRYRVMNNENYLMQNINNKMEKE